MADENPSQDLFKQFWSTMERMGMTAGKMPAQMLGMPAVPMPGGLAESQVAAIVGAIRASAAASPTCAPTSTLTSSSSS